MPRVYLSPASSLCVCLLLQGRGSGRRRTEAVANDDQDKPYVCDSKKMHLEDMHCVVTVWLRGYLGHVSLEIRRTRPDEAHSNGVKI